MATPLQHRAPALIAGLQAASPGDPAMAGFAIRTSFAGHASNSARADNALTFKLDHHMGAGHRQS